MGQDIVIYQDEGVGEFGLACLRAFFGENKIRLCDAADVVDGGIFKSAKIFIMPGGADLPYCAKLNGAGNTNIRRFVAEGGTYLGICAGAYYGCSKIEYHKGREDEICGPRELAFTKAIARGSLPELAPYYDLTLASAGIAEITLSGGTVMESFYHGGPAFFGVGAQDEIIARYEDIAGKPAAIIKTRMGKGQAILSGVHLEVSADDFMHYPLRAESDKDFIPAFQDRLSGISANGHALLKTLLGRA